MITTILLKKGVKRPKRAFVLSLVIPLRLLSLAIPVFFWPMLANLALRKVTTFLAVFVSFTEQEEFCSRQLDICLVYSERIWLRLVAH